MANIYDYIMWRGDLSFLERPFNDVDNVILSTLAYLDFKDIVPDDDKDDGVSLASACERLLEEANGDIEPYVRSLARIEIAFVELLAGSARFRDARLSFYENVVDDVRSLQFSALQVDLPNSETYVAFRGTDNTLVGWRENFMLSFTITEAQREAARYLERAVLRAERAGRKVLVGGHSKGGVLAEYASLVCAEQYRDAIKGVYSNDGPRMAPEVLARERHETLNDVFRHIVPTYSIVGMMFCDASDSKTIVKSDESGIEQHDPTTWQVLPDGLCTADALQEDCMTINRAIASWVSDISFEERERATNEIFDALEAGGATTMREIVGSAESFQQVLRAITSMDENTRDIVLKLVQDAISSSVDAVRKSALKAIDNTRRLLRGEG